MLPVDDFKPTKKMSTDLLSRVTFKALTSESAEYILRIKTHCAPIKSNNQKENNMGSNKECYHARIRIENEQCLIEENDSNQSNILLEALDLITSYIKESKNPENENVNEFTNERLEAGVYDDHFYDCETNNSKNIIQTNQKNLCCCASRSKTSCSTKPSKNNVLTHKIESDTKTVPAIISCTKMTFPTSPQPSNTTQVSSSQDSIQIFRNSSSQIKWYRALTAKALSETSVHHTDKKNESSSAKSSVITILPKPAIPDEELFPATNPLKVDCKERKRDTSPSGKPKMICKEQQTEPIEINAYFMEQAQLSEPKTFCYKGTSFTKPQTCCKEQQTELIEPFVYCLEQAQLPKVHYQRPQLPPESLCKASQTLSGEPSACRLKQTTSSGPMKSKDTKPQWLSKLPPKPNVWKKITKAKVTKPPAKPLPRKNECCTASNPVQSKTRTYYKKESVCQSKINTSYKAPTPVQNTTSMCSKKQFECPSKINTRYTARTPERNKISMFHKKCACPSKTNTNCNEPKLVQSTTNMFYKECTCPNTNTNCKELQTSMFCKEDPTCPSKTNTNSNMFCKGGSESPSKINTTYKNPQLIQSTTNMFPKQDDACPKTNETYKEPKQIRSTISMSYKKDFACPSKTNTSFKGLKTSMYCKEDSACPKTNTTYGKPKQIQSTSSMFYKKDPVYASKTNTSFKEPKTGKSCKGDTACPSKINITYTEPKLVQSTTNTFSKEDGACSSNTNATNNESKQVQNTTSLSYKEHSACPSEANTSYKEPKQLQSTTNTFYREDSACASKTNTNDRPLWHYLKDEFGDEKGLKKKLCWKSYRKIFSHCKPRSVIIGNSYFVNKNSFSSDNEQWQSDLKTSKQRKRQYQHEKERNLKKQQNRQQDVNNYDSESERGSNFCGCMPKANKQRKKRKNTMEESKYKEVNEQVDDQHPNQYIREIMKRIDEIKSELEHQNNDNKQIKELERRIRELYCTVNTLRIESEKRDRDQVGNCMGNLEGRCKFVQLCKDKPAMQVTKYNNMNIERKSSTCVFCQNKCNDLHHNNIYCLILGMIGRRSFDDVVITVLLQADNIYHLNVRCLRTGQTLGCILATDEAIEQSQYLGLFDQILTFFVIDTRYSNEQKQLMLGHAFELLHQPRQSGGTTATTDVSEDNLSSIDELFSDEEITSDILSQSKCDVIENSNVETESKTQESSVSEISESYETANEFETTPIHTETFTASGIEDDTTTYIVYQ